MEYRWLRSSSMLLLILFATIGIGAQTESQSLDGSRVIFRGTVRKVGPSPNSISGGVEVYQLVKYKINRVVLGSFSEPAVVVDHLILTGTELTRLRVGKTVCVSFLVSKEIGMRYDDEVLRKFADEPKYFYIGTVQTNRKGNLCKSK